MGPDRQPGQSRSSSSQEEKRKQNWETWVKFWLPGVWRQFSWQLAGESTLGTAASSLFWFQDTKQEASLKRLQSGRQVSGTSGYIGPEEQSSQLVVYSQLLRR